MSSLSIYRGKRVLVTGHCGFKGGWLSTWLTMLGAEVYGLSLEVPSNPSLFEAAELGGHLNDVRMNVCDNERLQAELARIKPHFVFHMAAQPLVKLSYASTLETWQSNLMGTVSVLEALRHYDEECVAVFITSDKCYDNVEWVWGYRETDALGGPDPYSASKGAAELAIKSYVKSFFPREGKVRVGVGRAGNVIGGGDWAADRIVPDCVRAWSEGRTVELRRPSATRPWQHVLEPLSGYLALGSALYHSSALNGEAFNFGPNLDDNYTVADVVQRLTETWTGAQWADVSAGEQGPYESGLLKLNCDKALFHLRWRASLTFDETVELTGQWYRSYYMSEGCDVYELTTGQIQRYTELAGERGVSWAH